MEEGGGRMGHRQAEVRCTKPAILDAGIALCAFFCFITRIQYPCNFESLKNAPIPPFVPSQLPSFINRSLLYLKNNVHCGVPQCKGGWGRVPLGGPAPREEISRAGALPFSAPGVSVPPGLCRVLQLPRACFPPVKGCTSIKMGSKGRYKL